MTPTEYQRRWRAKQKRRATDTARMAAMAERAQALHASQQPHPVAQTRRISGGNGSTAPENIAKAITCYEAYRTFKEEMAAIAEADYPSDQSRVTEILGSVIMLMAHDLPAAPSFHDLYALFYDIYDLAFGGRPAFFFQAPKPDDVKTKPKITFAHSVQGLLASAYAALSGPGGKKPAEAVQWLDDALKKWRVAALVNGKAIRGWYHQATAKRGRPARMLVDTFQEYQPQLSTLSSPAEAEAFAMQHIMLVALGKPPRPLKLRR
jgi:hypothetical protein